MKYKTIICFSIPAILWVVWLFAIQYADLGPAYNLTQKGQLGDSFGALSCLFSGLAFAGLLINILQQNEEIARIAADQEVQRNLNYKQLEIGKLSALLNYHNDSISHLRELLLHTPREESERFSKWTETQNTELSRMLKNREDIVTKLNS